MNTFPPITNDIEHAEAVLEFDALLELNPDPPPDSESGQRLRALAEVIEAYEKTRWPN
jgi:antitoxin component HigA of HigAB toxin-antitoxin module